MQARHPKSRSLSSGLPLLGLTLLILACADEPPLMAPAHSLVGESVPSAPVKPSLSEQTAVARTPQKSRHTKFETLEVYTKDGRLEVRLEGHGLSATQLAAARATSYDPTILDSVARMIDERIQRGTGNVATLRRVRQIIEVLKAPDDAVRHELVRRLPVRLVVTNVRDEQGRLGIQKVYTHESGRTIRTFSTLSESGDDSPVDPAHEGESEKLDLSENGDDFAATEAGSLLSTFNCEYTDDENVYYSGPCATEQEVEDATIETLAMDSEAAALESDTEASVSSYCVYHEEDLDVCADQNTNTDYLGLGGPSELFSCGGGKWMYAAALANYGWRAWKIWRAISIVTPAGAITEAVYLGGVAILALTGTTINFTACME